jgi:dolichol-phosphate mannosyltransferase
VDDGSQDATLTEALRLCGQPPPVRVLRHPHRCGQSAALCSGVSASRAAAWVAALDDNCRDDPCNIGVKLAATNGCGW